MGSLVTRETSKGARPSPPPLIRIITSWGLGQVCREVSPVSKAKVKQALVGQGMSREQENSHLEWPDHIQLLRDSINIIIINN